MSSVTPGADDWDDNVASYVDQQTALSQNLTYTNNNTL